MKFKLYLVTLLLVSTSLWAYPQIPGQGSSVPGTNLTASLDVVAASADTYNIGVSTNNWKNGYFKTIRLKADSDPTLDSGYGGVFVRSSDNELYYQNASTGAVKQISSSYAGDITSVGDCSAGDCFTATSGNWRQYWQNVAGGNKTELAANGPTADRVILIPDNSGTIPVKASAPIYISASGDLTLVNVSADKLMVGSIGNDRIVTNTLGPNQIDETANYAWTGQQDLSGATYLKVPTGANPTVNAAGEIAQDTTNDQILYGASADVLISERQICINDMDAVSTDDNVVFWTANRNSTFTKVGCRATASGTYATFQLSDAGGNNMTHNTPTCASLDAVATYQNITANNAILAGEGLAFSITNTLTNATGDYTLCATYKIDRT